MALLILNSKSDSGYRIRHTVQVPVSTPGSCLSLPAEAHLDWCFHPSGGFKQQKDITELINVTYFHELEKQLVNIHLLKSPSRNFEEMFVVFVQLHQFDFLLSC